MGLEPEPGSEQIEEGRYPVAQVGPMYHRVHHAVGEVRVARMGAAGEGLCAGLSN